MPIFGITGGVASGKSTVTRLLKQYGATVFSADEAARAVLSPHGPLLRAIAAEFGPEMLREDGSLDRARLGQRIFADPAARHRLENLMHPPILRLLHAQIEAAKEDFGPDSFTFVEVPLLFETNLMAWFDRIIVVNASETVQVERLGVRNRLDETEARIRLAAQMPLAAKKARADYVVENDGSLASLEKATAALWKRMVAEYPPVKRKK